MGFKKQASIALNAYIDDMRKSLESPDINELEDSINDDLLDKGFSEEEINDLLVLDKSNDITTLYKFMAYYMLIYDDWSTANELMNLIEEHYLLNLDEFSEDDIDNITLQRDNIDF